MKILVLEDDPERIRMFRVWFKDYDMDMTDQASEAKKLLDSKLYDVIFLDHDLDGRVFVHSSEANTGYAVASYIPKSINKGTRTIVHSHNFVGATKMVDAVGENAKYHPFGTFNETII